MAIMLLAVVGAFEMAWNKGINWNYKFTVLTVLGYFCMIPLVEAQSRYKCLLMPYVICIAAIGIMLISEYLPIKENKKNP